MSWPRVRSRTRKNLYHSLLLIILSIFLGRFFNLRLVLAIEAVRVDFGDLPILFGSIWLGPWWGLFIGGSSDVLGFLLYPSYSYLPQITLVAMLRGFLPGFLVRYTGDSTQIKNLAIQVGLTQILCSILLMPPILYLSFGTPLLQNILTRIIVQLSMIPFLSSIYFALKHLKATEATKKKEEELNLILSSTPTVVYSYSIGENGEAEFIFINDNVQEILGFQAQDFVGHMDFWVHSVHPDDIQKVMDRIARLKEEETIKMEYRFKDNRGHYHWLLDRQRVIHRRDGNIEVIGAWIDITDRKEGERLLYESEMKYRTLFEESVLAIYLHDLDGNIFDVNQIASSLLGYPREELLTMRIFDLHAESSDKNLSEEETIHRWKQWLPEERFFFERDLQHKDGSTIPVQVSTGLVQYGDREMLLAMVQDISGPKEAQDALKKSEERYRTIFDFSPVGIMIEDRDGNIIEVNKALCQMSGYREEELEGSSVFDTFVLPEHQDFAKENISRILAGEELNFDILSKKGDHGLQHKQLRETKIPLPDGREGILSIHVDITKEKKAKERLQRLTERLNEEIERASQIHARILPTDLPEVEGLSFAAHYQPAERIGGDFYGIERVEHKLILYLSDVSGHGLDGSMLSLFVKHTIHGFLNFTPVEAITPASILKYLQRQFVKEDFPQGYFISIFMGILDLETMEFTYSGAGFQDRPLVQMESGEQVRLKCRGLFITSLSSAVNYSFHQESIALTPGTTIFFNTDGLTEEGVNGEYYMDRLPEVFYNNAHRRPELIVEAVVEDFRQFNHGLLQGKDDITILVMHLDTVEKKRDEER